MGGMAVGPLSLHEQVRLARKDFGGVVAPRAAWNILVYGLSSLSVRMERQIRSGMTVSSFLENHPKVRRVFYPGLKSHPQHETAVRQMLDFKGRFAPGLMIYFELETGEGDPLALTRTFMDFIAANSYVLTLAVSLGQAKTLIEAPPLMTHSVYGVRASTAGMSFAAVRLSIGIEDADDIIADLDEALGVLK